MVEAYPLHWPPGWPRTARPERARFGNHSRAQAVSELINEVRQLGGRNIVISTNLELRLDGLPRSSQKAPDDQGVAVYFELNGVHQCFPCDRWTLIEHNLWAIAKSIGALRGLERWGAKTMVAAAFRGFQALPDLRNFYFQDFKTKDEARAKYLELAKKLHPDAGGNAAEFADMKRQYEELT